MQNRIKKIGFLLEHLGPSQLAYQLIKSANELCDNSDEVDICLFYKNFGPVCIPPNVGIFTSFDAFGYNGILVTTDLAGAQASLRWPGPNRHKLYFYLNNLEWLLLRGNVPYEMYAEVYLNDKINLICRSEEHADMVRIAWKEPFAVVENANARKFAEVLQ